MAKPVTDIDIATLLLKAHRHVWRADAPPLELERDELLALMPTLLEIGSAGLVWPRLERSSIRFGAGELLLRRAHDLQADQNHLIEERIGQSVERLGAVGIRPVIIKGWSLSRRYPPGLVRAAGDIDLIVSEADYDCALETLAAWSSETGEVNVELHHSDHRLSSTPAPRPQSARRVDIDLHRDTHWDSIPAPDALRRATPVTLLNGLEIGVLCPEDNLRQLSFHYLWHGATRLLRLADIALVLESRPDDFDWDRCLGDDPMRRNWVVTTLGLAHRLLGARIDDTPLVEDALRLPRWLLPISLRQVQQNQPPLGAAVAEFRRNPRKFGTILRRRWPDPITATTHLPTAFTERPRLPIQWAVYLGRIFRHRPL